MKSIEAIQQRAELEMILDYSLLLIGALSLLSFPGFVALWFLRRKPIWLKLAVGALSIVVMSIIIPLYILLSPGEQSGSAFYLPVN